MTLFYKKTFLVLSRKNKKVVVVMGDIVLAFIAMWCAYSLRLEELHSPNSTQLISFFLSIFCFLPIFKFFGVYDVVFRHLSIGMMVQLLKATIFYALMLTIVLVSLALETVPRSVGLIQPLIFFTLICSVRVLTVSLIFRLSNKERRKVLVYGAGNIGSQLVSALETSKPNFVFGFVDDDPQKQGCRLINKYIYGADQINLVVTKYQITDVVLALPSSDYHRRQEIVDSLLPLKVRISSAQNFFHWQETSNYFENSHGIDFKDLLVRQFEDTSIGQFTISHKCILVTGAGGSIGSEICRQLVRQDIADLVLVENGEFNLYSIDQALRAIVRLEKLKVRVWPILANVRELSKIQQIFDQYKPQVVYHAAAFKHVPLLETNPIEAIRNNFFATVDLGKLAIQNKVKCFVLISSDKAVRATNVMGASKRLAELSMQLFAEQKTKTIFTMVRFGNVIGSSGSAIPLFQSQILQGGPVTVTHPEVSRYFMSVDEAVELVLRTGEMAHGGEVFVLDMGKPIKIIDLVRRMIRLNGKVEKTEENPWGDISINYIGFRPGEKMHEELILGEKLDPTQHPRIFCARESSLTKKEFDYAMRYLGELIEQNDLSELRRFLTKDLKVLYRD